MTDSNTDKPIRITGICGSLNPEGATKKALTIALNGAAEYPVEISLLDLMSNEEFETKIVRLIGVSGGTQKTQGENCSVSRADRADKVRRSRQGKRA